MKDSVDAKGTRAIGAGVVEDKREWRAPTVGDIPVQSTAISNPLDGLPDGGLYS